MNVTAYDYWYLLRVYPGHRRTPIRGSFIPMDLVNAVVFSIRSSPTTVLLLK